MQRCEKMRQLLFGSCKRRGTNAACANSETQTQQHIQKVLSGSSSTMAINYQHRVKRLPCDGNDDAWNPLGSVRQNAGQPPRDTHTHRDGLPLRRLSGLTDQPEPKRFFKFPQWLSGLSALFQKNNLLGVPYTMMPNICNLLPWEFS